MAMDEFSVTPEVAEVLVPDGLFSVRFETRERVPGVRLPPSLPK